MAKKPSARPAAKKPTQKSTVARGPSKARRPVVRARSNKVDYYPNRMTVAVSALAGTILVLVAVIAVIGSRS